MMIIYLEDVIENNEKITEEVIKEINNYINNKEYKTTTLEIITSRREETEEMRANVYLHKVFSFWINIYKSNPEFLILLRGDLFTEIIFSFYLYAKTDSKEILTYSYEKALEKGIEKEYLNQRYNDYYKLAV